VADRREVDIDEAIEYRKQLPPSKSRIEWIAGRGRKESPMFETNWACSDRGSDRAYAAAGRGGNTMF